MGSVGGVGGVVGVGVVDNLESVVGAAGDVAGDGPAVAARVGEALCEIVLVFLLASGYSKGGLLTGNVDSRGQVVAGAGTEDDGNGARGSGLPGQVKGLAGSDAVVVGVGEGVAVGKGQQGRGHEGNEGLSRETHLDVL